MQRASGTRMALIGLTVGVAIILLLLISANSAQSATSRARMADDFVDTIGINTHLRFLDTAYSERYPLVRDKLTALGVRHIRDGAFVSSQSSMNDLVYGRYRELAGYGIRSNLVVDPRVMGPVNADKIAQVREMAGPSLESFEGPNEYNLSGRTTWAQDLTTYQENLYGAVKGNLSTSDTPVLAPALGRPYPDKKPDLRAYADYANMHSYPGGDKPSVWGLDHYIIPAAREVGGTKPLMATESGYHTAANWTGVHPKVSEKAMGKYMPRLMFEYFNRGIRKTYAYELIDPGPDPNGLGREKNFGLLRNDGTEKPAYRSLKNTISLLEDPGPRFETGSLGYSLGGDLANVHRTLLQKRDGSFYLVLWQETSSYDLQAKRDTSVPANKVNLTLDRPVSRATAYLPVNSTTPVKQYASLRQMTLYVSDTPLIVKLTPSANGGPTPVNSVPKITNVRPNEGGSTRDRTPLISALVRDAQINLAKPNISLFVDRRRKTSFTYNQAKDRLTYKPAKKLQSGRRHHVKIVARDPQGPDANKQWRFKVIK